MIDAELLDQVRRVVAAEIEPLLGMDGTSVEVVAIERGVVQVRVGGSSGCCPTSTYALIMGIEEELRRRVPQIEYLEAVP